MLIWYTSPTKHTRSTRATGIDARSSANEKIYGVWTLNSQTQTQLPDGRRREIEGSISAIRLLRPLVNDTRFSEKNQVKSRRLFKISETSNDIYDILKPALAIQTWQCRGWGDFHSRPTTHKRILRMPRDSIAEIEIKYNIFLF